MQNTNSTIATILHWTPWTETLIHRLSPMCDSHQRFYRSIQRLLPRPLSAYELQGPQYEARLFKSSAIVWMTKRELSCILFHPRSCFSSQARRFKPSENLESQRTVTKGLAVGLRLSGVYQENCFKISQWKHSPFVKENENQPDREIEKI